MRWFVLGVLLWSLPSLTWAVCTPQALAAEITEDPQSLGYAAYTSVGNDAAVLTLLTTVHAGDAAYVVSKGLVTTQSARGTWGDVITLIQTNPPGGSETLKEKWKWNIQVLFVPFGTLDYGDPSTAGFFAAMVSDGLLTAEGPITNEIVTARTTRAGSRAEVLCGVTAADVLTLSSISCALRDQGCQ